MFAFGPYIPTHNYCCNPFGATFANPRINFALGIAAATAMPIMPMYRPVMPVFGYGFNRLPYAPMPNFGTLTAQNSYNIAPTHNYTQYFNRLPQVQIYAGFNQTTNGQTSNPFGLFNNPGDIKINKNYFGKIYDNTTSKQSTASTTSTQTTTTVDTSKISTDGQTLDRSGSDYGPEFLAKVKEIAQRLNCDYRDLLGLMNSESGIRADIKNPNSSASGLIQFIESTANSLGTTTAELRAMDPIDQLDYVERYLSRAKANAGITGKLSAGDLYSLVFLPGRAHREVLTSSGENYYSCNKGLDLNKDGHITKSELSQRVYDKRVSDNSFLA